ncbi:outer membrane lipoprotein chaperone LolA [Maridesulfovibrio hydrothermalis]|uniref:Outer-membrane lipoprotein carrier protein n=1 Tax=Maridesulfovibrio hydrothermalis AM13 = DSM 14728 TaxID=1121451 RepID=L0REK0_9BACT|nr:outer membrane lipoprotein chaperone LolA [Maridesulfovibrio hydrothermalis]CCO24637.1 Outer membrane lipoprotein carrier protein LolA [Maridesulfovibrio hydrothermalis AM13 = DSM 14728]
MHFRILILIISIMLSFSTIASAAELTTEIQKTYDAIRSFKADFTQTLTNAASKEQEVRTGQIVFKQPSLLRWESVKPEKELLIVGESVVWDYFPEDRVAFKYRTKQLFNSKTMIKFISGKAKLEEDFVVENQGNDNGLIKLKLLPLEPETGLVLAYVWVDPEKKMLAKTLVIDFYGNGNEVTMTNVEIDPEVDDTLFQFTPPDGVDVEDNTKNN